MAVKESKEKGLIKPHTGEGLLSDLGRETQTDEAEVFSPGEPSELSGREPALAEKGADLPEHEAATSIGKPAKTNQVERQSSLADATGGLSSDSRKKADILAGILNGEENFEPGDLADSIMGLNDRKEE